MVAVEMETPSLHRRNTISGVVSGKLRLPVKPQSSSFPITHGDKNFPTELIDWELISVRPTTYTSLKDILTPSPAGIQSPTADRCSCNSGEISIKNRLVKQAAWAYLQPMSSSPSSGGQNFFRSLWIKFYGEYIRNPLRCCLSFVHQHVFSKISEAFNCLLSTLQFRKSGQGNGVSERIGNGTSTL